MIDLEAIKARCEAATPGPWLENVSIVHVDAPDETPSRDAIVADTHWDGKAFERVRGDAEFIAHARQDVPALVAEVERMRAANEQVFHAWGRLFYAHFDKPSDWDALLMSPDHGWDNRHEWKAMIEAIVALRLVSSPESLQIQEDDE